jgi:hypothetical protein
MRCLGRPLWILGIGALWAQGGLLGQGQGPGLVDPALQAVVEQNQRLQEQVKQQEKTIETLTKQMDEIRRASERHERELRSLQGQADPGSAEQPGAVESRDHEVRIGGEAGLAFFHTGRDGQFPNSEFRVDDATITVEAPVWKNAYFFGELKLFTREASTANFQVGELYVDFERLGTGWGQPDSLNLRAGSINVPFGEEYLVRGPIANPLISHSLSDLWGQDEGVELYGRAGTWQYVLAVQNGGISQTRDFHSGKSVTARLGWDPRDWLHVSASAMRTGKLTTVVAATGAGDGLSAVWFASAFFRALGPASRTAEFWASLYEADAVVRWPGGRAGAALGQVQFDDSDPLADNARRLRYGYLEAMQSITDQLYGAARYSQINAPGGYPLAGWGNMGEYFFRPSLTDELRRFSLGFGYRFGPPLVLKLEYSWEWGRTTSGEARDHEDFFGTEVGLKF